MNFLLSIIWMLDLNWLGFCVIETELSCMTCYRSIMYCCFIILGLLLLLIVSDLFFFFCLLWCFCCRKFLPVVFAKCFFCFYLHEIRINILQCFFMCSLLIVLANLLLKVAICWTSIVAGELFWVQDWRKGFTRENFILCIKKYSSVL